MDTLSTGWRYGRPCRPLAYPHGRGGCWWSWGLNMSQLECCWHPLEFALFSPLLFPGLYNLCPRIAMRPLPKLSLSIKMPWPGTSGQTGSSRRKMHQGISNGQSRDIPLRWRSLCPSMFMKRMALSCLYHGYGLQVFYSTFWLATSGYSLVVVKWWNKQRQCCNPFGTTTKWTTQVIQYLTEVLYHWNAQFQLHYMAMELEHKKCSPLRYFLWKQFWVLTAINARNAGMILVVAPKPKKYANNLGTLWCNAWTRSTIVIWRGSCSLLLQAKNSRCLASCVLFFNKLVMTLARFARKGFRLHMVTGGLLWLVTKVIWSITPRPVSPEVMPM